MRYGLAQCVMCHELKSCIPALCAEHGHEYAVCVDCAADTVLSGNGRIVDVVVEEVTLAEELGFYVPRLSAN